MKPLKYCLFVCFTFFVAYVHAQEPKSPADLPLEKFAQLPQMKNAELSPDGEYIAYLFPLEGRNHIVMQPIADFEQRKIVPPAGKLEFSWVQWANNDRLVFAASFAGERFKTETTETRLASIKKDGTDVVWIIRAATTEGAASPDGSASIPPQIQDDVVSWLPDEPNHILVALDENFDGEDEVRRVDITSGDYTNVRDGLPGIQNWMLDAAGDVRLGFGYDEDEFTLKFLDSQKRWIDGATTDWWDSGWHPVAFTDDPSVAYVIGPNNRGLDVVRKMNIETGEFVEDVFDAGDYDVGGVVLSALTRQPIGVSFTDHMSKVVYFDKDYDKLQRTAQKAFAGMAVRLLSLSADKRQLLVLVSSDTDPGVLYFWDRDAKSMDVYNESMPGLTPELLSKVQPVTYAARDGQKIPGYLTVPLGQASKNLPTIVMPHGGPVSRSGKRFEFLVQFLASRGYAVFQPNFRGSSGYGSDYLVAGQQEWGGLMQDDITDGTKWLIESGVADANRLCIVGWSYGGYAAAMGAVKTPDLYKCAVSINGPLDLPKMASEEDNYSAQAWVRSFGLEGEKLNAISPFHQAERIEIPMLLIQAEDDANVHNDQAERMHQRLIKLKKPADLVTLGLGGHYMDNVPAREKILESLEVFLNQNIGGV